MNSTRIIAAGAAILVSASLMPATAAAASPDSSAEDYRREALTGLMAAMHELPAVRAASTDIDSRRGARTPLPQTFQLDEHLECIPVEHLFYCPLDGWHEDVPNRKLAESGAAERNPDGSVVPDGDLSPIEFLDQIRQLSPAEQRALVEADLQGAVEITGKVLADSALMDGVTPSPEVLAAFPEAREYALGITPRSSIDVRDHATIVPMVNPNFTHRLITSTNAGKQEKSYWCGPASVAFMSYHDPVVKNSISHSQTTWASWLGTTTAGTGIYNIRTQVNNRLTGFKNRVGGYGVHSVASWTVGDWANRFSVTTRTKQAPIVLHPKLTSSNSTYIPAGWSTGGHFNVGVGYRTYSSGSDGWIFEPWAADGSVPKFVWESMSNIRTQNLANSSHRNIAY